MGRLLILSAVLLSFIYFEVDCACQFHNPLWPGASPDPWMIYHDGHYYFCKSADGGIKIYKSEFLSNWKNAQAKVVWRPPANGGYSKELWAPELHFLNGKWYVYFAADDGQNKNHRMHVLESNSGDAMGDYHFASTLDTEGWAIDGTVMHYQNKMYFVWSGWVGANDGMPQHLFIAEMSSPTKLSSRRVLIASPQFEWEKDGVQDRKGLLEGPEALYSPKGKVFITFSAAASWTEFYKIGALELTGNNPLDRNSWHHIPNFLFGENKANSVYGTGHASFVKSKDGKEDYIVYHAMEKPDGGWEGRTARIQKFHWDDRTQYPVFGAPEPLSRALPSPSGECPQ